jgi:serine/threonine protein kinase
MGTLLQTNPGTVMGTLEYMSPEQARAQEADVRSDVWSLGCVIYEMLAGRGPFGRQSAAETLAAILREEPKPLDQFDGDIPVELQRIVLKTLAKQRSARYQTVPELLADLKALKQEREFRQRLESR